MKLSLGIVSIERFFFHVLPGTSTLCIAPGGTKQVRPLEVQGFISPDVLVQKAQEYKCKSLTFLNLDVSQVQHVMQDIASTAREHELKTFFVSKSVPSIPGSLLSVLEGVAFQLSAKGLEKQDLTFFSKLQQKDTWVEIHGFVLPLQESIESLHTTAVILQEIAPETPLHLSPFTSQLTEFSTLPEHLAHAKQLTQDLGMYFVYLRKTHLEKAANTYCVACKKLLVGRTGFGVVVNNIRECKCGCGKDIPGRWE
jgi:pyruvate formate lyase activating enzyme